MFFYSLNFPNLFSRLWIYARYENGLQSSSPPARNNRIVHFFFALAHTSHLAKSGESKRYEPETNKMIFHALSN